MSPLTLHQCVALLLSGFALLLPTCVASQPISAIAGEHLGFTRVVFQSTRTFPWSLEQSGDRLHIRLPRERLRIDHQRLFSLIPRDRLREASPDAEGAVLHLGCDCRVDARLERTGILVIDLHDNTPMQTVVPASPIPGRRAGATLAARLRTAQIAVATPPPSFPETLTAGITNALARRISASVAQGMIAPAIATQTPSSTEILSSSADQAASANLRIYDANAARPDATPDHDAITACPEPELLASLMRSEAEPVRSWLPDIGGLFTEFDRPDATNVTDLAARYIREGFGAEASQILMNLDTTSQRAVWLGGIADLLEQRSSNRTLVLAQTLACPAPMPPLAALAGAPDAEVRRRAIAVATSYGQLSSGLRLAFGADLVRRLTGVGAIDAARIVLESYARLAMAPPSELTTLGALLDQARGESERASTLLVQAGSTTPEATRLQLELAIADRSTVPEERLEQATALAADHRHDSDGQNTAIAAIRIQAREGRFANAFADFDRVRAWLPDTPSNRGRLSSLNDELWASVVERSSEADLLEFILSRPEWREPGFPSGLVAPLRERLSRLGLGILGEQVAALSGPDPLGRPASSPIDAGGSEPNPSRSSSRGPATLPSEGRAAPTLRDLPTLPEETMPLPALMGTASVASPSNTPAPQAAQTLANPFQQSEAVLRDSAHLRDQLRGLLQR